LALLEVIALQDCKQIVKDDTALHPNALLKKVRIIFKYASIL